MYNKTMNVKKTMSLNSMYFNRFLLIRYTISLFFFSNLYWLVLLKVTYTSLIPLFLIILLILPIYENFKCFGEKNSNMRSSQTYIKIQLICNLFLMVICISPIFIKFFPMLNEEIFSRTIMCGFLILGSILLILCLKKLQKIESNSDKYYGYIEKIEKSIDVK